MLFSQILIESSSSASQWVFQADMIKILSNIFAKNDKKIVSKIISAPFNFGEWFHENKNELNESLEKLVEDYIKMLAKDYGKASEKNSKSITDDEIKAAKSIASKIKNKLIDSFKDRIPLDINNKEECNEIKTKIINIVKKILDSNT